ncbi:histone-arginine methyltransferase METTL23 [Penaeus vannamei]|uniref:Putative methyltransferase-like protein 23 n=1 Tax=Penaeus vannamei TaxID=6689 RepID=A0A3R7PJ62_PENVA|nr:methyltransferase-like protein 23 [Penaeus vannamei]ROT73538.1 putative methyltransferase-like protein 23 [Penaeus vannamei]
MAEVPQHVRKFLFRSCESRNSASSECLEVLIPEVVSPSYGMYTWPCAPVLAQYVWYHRHDFPKRNVLELGAGTALPGIVAAKCGANVILSDSGQLPKCLRNCQVSCQANGIVGSVAVVGITWGLFTPELLDLGPIDIILGSDCFYDPAVFEDILVTVSFLLEHNPHARFVCSYQERASDWSLEHLLHKWNLSCTQLPLATFDADIPNIADSNLPGSHTVHVFQITRTARS